MCDSNSTWFTNFFENEFCGYDLTKLRIDDAYVTVTSTENSNTTFELHSKHLECIKCPFQSLQNVSERGHVILQQAPQTIYRIFKPQTNFSVPTLICSQLGPFGDWGIYNIKINSSNASCTTEIIKQPIDELTTISIVASMYAIMVLLIWFCIKKIWPVTKQQNEEPASRPRVNSLDSFRGICIISMIFCNMGGGNYFWIEHTLWNGLHLADIIFPCFLWIMGVCIPISIRSKFNRKTPECHLTILKECAKRSLKLFMLGIVLSSGVFLDQLRIPGVLQRFAICYFSICLVSIYVIQWNDSLLPGGKILNIFRDILKTYKGWIIIITISIIHAMGIYLVPIPACERGYTGPGGWHENGKHYNCTGGFTGYVDRLLLNNHIYQHLEIRSIYKALAFDPEGIWGTLNCIVQVYFGFQAGIIHLEFLRHKDKIYRWLIWGVATGVLSAMLCSFSQENGIVPINKKLWSISFVLATTSIAFILLSACYVLIDWKCCWSGGPFHHAGMNSILLYAGHMTIYWNFPFRWYLNHTKPYHNTHFSALFAHCWGTLLWCLVSYYLFRKKYFYTI